jgi:iron transport multicopper oxidase
VPTQGNAAANTEDFYDLTGANVSPAPLPDGFETKGIVAMTFSILAGLLGIGTVIWYGLGEMGTIEEERERRKIDKIATERGVVSRANTGLTASNGNQSQSLGGTEEISRAP